MYAIKLLFVFVALVATSNAGVNRLLNGNILKNIETVANTPDESVAVSNLILKSRAVSIQVNIFKKINAVKIFRTNNYIHLNLENVFINKLLNF